MHSGSNDPAIGWDTAGDLRLGTSTSNVGGGFSEKMRIDASGNVGIGTTSPQSKLHIKQSVDSIDGGLTWESVNGTQEWSIDANNAGNFRRLFEASLSS